MYRLLFNCAKTGGKAAVTYLCDAGAVRAFANLTRTPHHPEFVWDTDLAAPVVMMLKLLAGCDQRRCVAVHVLGLCVVVEGCVCVLRVLVCVCMNL